MNTTINQTLATAGEPLAFTLPTLPLALPEPFESKCARCGIEPWMYEQDFEKFHNATADRKAAAYEQIDAVEFFVLNNPIAPGDRYATYQLLRDVALKENKSAYDVFQENSDRLARSIARDAVRALQAKRWAAEQRAMDRKQRKLSAAA